MKMQPYKRRKTLLACNQCRDRKTRCSGDRPVCRYCQERQLQCRYDHGSIRTSSLPTNIERRLKSLEQLGYRTQHSTGLDPARQPCPLDPRQHAINQLPSTPGDAIQGSLNEDISSQTVQGASSTDSFLSQVSSMTHALKQRVWPPIALSTPNEGASRSSQSGDVPVPELDVALALIECFWQNIHPVFPLLHRPSVLQAYDLLCEPHQAQAQAQAAQRYQDNNTFQAILNIVFALGIQYDNQVPFEQRVTTAHSYYEKSLSFVSPNTIDIPTQSHVQLFLLTAVYLHSTAYANRCWDMVGAGLRVAISLGLFRENGGFHGKESQLKREMRRRIWFCCVVLDKMSAATFGRPTTLPRSWKVVLPKAIDDEFLQCVGEGSQPLGLPSYMEGFVYSLGVFEILDDVLAVTDTLSEDENADHDRNQGTKFVHRLADTMSLNSRLDDLVEHMPDHLKISKNSEHALAQSKRSFYVQAQILHCRIHYVRLLILRPWLIDEIHSASPTSLGKITLQELRSLCILTARQTIDMIFESAICRPQSSSWHAVYFLHAAASILLAAALLPQSSGKIDLACEPYQTSWNRATQTLKNNRVQLQASLQAVEMLESCREKLSIERAAEDDEPLLVQDAEAEGTPGEEINVDWAIDFESLDFLSADSFLNPESAY